jgi:hypothetical protein
MRADHGAVDRNRAGAVDDGDGVATGVGHAGSFALSDPLPQRGES